MSSISLYKPFCTEKENILFLHGFLENSDTWLPFLEKLSDTYNCLLYDFPGHGSNEAITVEQLSFDSISNDIVSSLNTLNISKSHLVCHSMGGYFGNFLKANFPQYFHKVVISNALLETDTELQLKKREKTIRVIHRNLPLLCKLSFTQYKGEHKVRKEAICNQSNPNYLVVYQKLLSQREDHTSLLRDYPNDISFIFGQYDDHIPWKQANVLTKKRQYILLNEGHTLPIYAQKEWISYVLKALK